MKIKQISTKKNITSTIVLLGLLSLFFLSSSLMVSKETTLQAFEEALMENDTKKLTTLLTSADDNLEMTEENISKFLTYLNQFENDKTELLAAIKSGENHKLISIKTAKKWLFFEEYLFEINPFHIEFIVDENVKAITIKGIETIVPSQAGFVRSGPLVPGIYEFIAKHSMDYAPNYETTNTLAVVPIMTTGEENIVKTKVNTKSIIVTSADTHGGKIFINGQDTGIIIDGYKTKLVGIPTDGSVKIFVEKQFPWGNITSEEIAVTSSKIFFQLDPTNQKVKGELLQFANELSESLKVAIEKKDPYVIDYISPKARLKIASHINELIEREMKVEGIEVVPNVYTYTLGERDIEQLNLKLNEEHYGGGITLKVPYSNQQEGKFILYLTYRLLYNVKEKQWDVFDVHTDGLNLNGY